MRTTRVVWAAVCLWLVLAAATVGYRENEAAHAQTPARLTLAPNYVPQRIDSPNAEVGGGFGNGPLVNGGDLNRDGEDDLLVPQQAGNGRVVIVSGATGAALRTLAAPDPSTGGSPARFGQYVGRIEDIGSCPGGQPSQLCPANPIGGTDGVPDTLVGAINVDFGPALDIGRAYLLDGATGALLKRIDMPAADRGAQAALGVFPMFGRTVLNPSSAYPASAPQEVKIGDLDGGGRPDIVVGASTYGETGPTTNPSCNPGPCMGAGRTYFYRGEDIANTDPNAILDTPFKILKNPIAQTDDPNRPASTIEAFGHSVTPIGDIGKCNIDPGPGAICSAANSTVTPDGRPDVVLSAHWTDWPPGFWDAGVAYVVDGATGAVLFRHDHPEPQSFALFGFTLGNQPAIGDVGQTLLPDIFLPAYVQRAGFVGQGRGWVINGDFKARSDIVILSQLDDPTPQPSGNFGVSAAGVGDVAGDPRNEILVGAWGPISPGIEATIVNDVHIFSPLSNRALLSVADPDQQPGSSFGSGVAPLGDVNNDGFFDFAAGAPSWDGPAGVNQGRLYIFRSSPASPSPSPTPSPSPSPSAPGASTVARSLSLNLQGHLVASGALSAAPRTLACIASAPVAIERDGRAVAQIRTAANGRYRVRLPDRPGRYRALAGRLVQGSRACARAASVTRRHRH